MKRNLRFLTAVSLALSLLITAAFCPLQVMAQTGEPILQSAAKNTRPAALIPGGYPFGVKFTTQGVLVVGFRDITTENGSQNPAKDAGIKLKDVIIALNDAPVDSAQALSDQISASGGSPVSVTYLRGENEMTATLTPVLDENGAYRTGLYVRDSGAGIGTLTYIDPETLTFGGLGHGICDIDTGELMPVRRGNVVEVTVSGIKRGVAGNPGEIKGYFHTGKIGTLRQNCACGVFGVLSEIPDGIENQAIPLGTRDEVHTGEAEILCTLSANERRSYTVTLSAIDRDAKGSKCFSIQVTDPALLEESGGIIQGMSGSPVIQDGKLIGAVTHVLISDPARGYGIFIENMLEQMDNLAG
ncbi:MAG: SpoIVB peptidase [Clostridia bacterium]|nr:SpoIVB peptidase [Clostridia bacterium]